MTESLPCPVCAPAQPLRALDLHLGLRVPIRRCDRCHGIWTDGDTAAVANRYYHAAHYVLQRGHGRQSCRRCSVLLQGFRVECAACNADQSLRCVQCGRRMNLVQIAGIILDVCRPCRTVWFDRGELGLIVDRHAAALRQRLAVAPAGEVAGSSGLELDWVPLPDAVGLGVELADVAGRAALEAVTAAPELVTGAGDLAVSAGSSAAELAFEAGDALLSLLGCLFD